MVVIKKYNLNKTCEVCNKTLVQHSTALRCNSFKGYTVQYGPVIKNTLLYWNSTAKEWLGYIQDRPDGLNSLITYLKICEQSNVH